MVNKSYNTPTMCYRLQYMVLTVDILIDGIGGDGDNCNDNDNDNTQYFVINEHMMLAIHNA